MQSPRRYIRSRGTNGCRCIVNGVLGLTMWKSDLEVQEIVMYEGEALMYKINRAF